MPKEAPSNQSTQPKPALGAWLLVSLTILASLIMTLFYTVIPIAGLPLLPFLFFGSVCLIVGVCDDLGLYR